MPFVSNIFLSFAFCGTFLKIIMIQKKEKILISCFNQDSKL